MSQGSIRRKDKEMSAEDAVGVLARAALAHFATVSADGSPYVVPNLFVFAEGKLYLHTTAASGHFRGNVEQRPRVCFESAEMGQVFPYGEFLCDTSASYVSVVGFGAIRILGEREEKTRFFDRFLAKYADPSWGRHKGFYPRLDETTVYRIDPDRITGKRGPLLPASEQWPHRNRTASPGAVPPGG